jgi:ABC-type oligopeptide transport system substrate-binding subunit
MATGDGAGFCVVVAANAAPESAAEYSYQLYYIKNARAFNEGKITDFNEVGVRVIDDYTLEVALDNPTHSFSISAHSPHSTRSIARRSKSIRIGR